MKENNTQNGKNPVYFENLKRLKSILEGSEFQNFLTGISKAKKSLEVFCKNIRAKSNDILAKENTKPAESVVKAVDNVQEKKVEETIAKKPIVEPEKVLTEPIEASANLQNDNNQKPLEKTNQNTNYQNKQTGEYGNRTFNKFEQQNGTRTFDPNRKPFDPNRQQRPYDPNRPQRPYDPNRQQRPFDPNRPQRPFDPNRQQRPYDPNRPQRPYDPNRQQRPYDPNRPQRPYDPNRPQRPFDPNRPRPAFNKDGANSTGRPNGLLPKFDKADSTLYIKPERNFGNKNKSKQVGDQDRKELSIKSKMKMGYIVDDDFNIDDENETRVIGRVKQKSRKPKMEQITPEKINIEKAEITTENLTVKILAEKIGKPASDIMKKFMMLGLMPTINSIIDFPTAELVASEFGVTLTQNLAQTYEDQLNELFNDKTDEVLTRRPPIVTVMGHVDHGKTMLLDAIKKTNVVAGEAGGITQHIGAYSVEIKNNKITFIDTPGHEAFTAMRARGAKITDLAILVVAADDGIMPQTVEAINHIKAANVPMLVAINKIDKPEANIERVKQQLTEYNVIPEEWGGDTVCVPISAKTGENIDKLLEMVLLVSEVTDLTADSNKPASGYILESKIDKGRGIVATVIVKDGTLRIGDFVISGTSSGRVKAMMDYKGEEVKVAGPSMAVSVLAFNTVPEAGELVYVVDEKMAKNIIAERTAKSQLEKSKQTSGITLEDFLQKNVSNEIKVLNIIIKADVQGSSEALKDTLEKIHNDEVTVHCVHSSVGGINESDVLLAQASKAIIIGFNVRPEAKAKVLAEKNGVDIKLYRIIYEAVDDITNAINGMLKPKFEEIIDGHIEIRHIYKISNVGAIAGCYVLDGFVTNKSSVRLLRNNVVVAETEIETLQQQKDQSKMVKSGFECGIKLKNYNDIKINDIIEVYEMKQI